MCIRDSLRMGRHLHRPTPGRGRRGPPDVQRPHQQHRHRLLPPTHHQAATPMRPRTDEHALAAITAAAEQLAHDRSSDHTDLTYIGAMSDLAATAEALITTTIAQMDPDQRDWDQIAACLLYTSPSPRDRTRSRMPS